MSHAQKLRALLERRTITVIPSAADALSARLIAAAGFEALFMSGFAVSAARLARPDTGLISLAEMVDTLRNVCAAAPAIPVVGDGDTGFGNAINVQRTVYEYARAGAACVMIEDQVSPKKCGHTPGKQVIGHEEARMKLRAAVEAARANDVLVLARTDARAVAGFDEALSRCAMFVEEGADIIFLEAPESVDEMRAFCAAIPKPCLANMVYEGKTPVLSARELEAIGYKIALYPLVLLAAAIKAMEQALVALKPSAPGAMPPTASFDEIQTVVGFPDYWAAERRFAAE